MLGITNLYLHLGATLFCCNSKLKVGLVLPKVLDSVCGKGSGLQRPLDSVCGRGSGLQRPLDSAGGRGSGLRGPWNRFVAEAPAAEAPGLGLAEAG